MGTFHVFILFVSNLFFIFILPQNTNYDSIQQTARSIAEQAHELAYDPNYMSPFAQFACDNGLNVRGESSRRGSWIPCPFSSQNLFEYP